MGSALFEDALELADGGDGSGCGCGCDRLREAEAMQDGSQEREVAIAAAEKLRDAWGCPIKTHEFPTDGDREELPRTHVVAIEAVERLTGAKCLQTCPGFYVRLPWVHEAVRARNWREHGSLHPLVGMADASLVQAIDLIDRGSAERQRREAPKPKRSDEHD